MKRSAAHTLTIERSSCSVKTYTLMHAFFRQPNGNLELRRQAETIRG